VLRVAATRGRIALDAVPDWILVVDASGKILQSNEPTGASFDGATHEATDKDLVDLIPVGAKAALPPHLKRVSRTGRSSEYEFIHGGGRWGELRLFPLASGELLCVIRDITSQRSREGQLRQTRDRYALALQGAADGTWDWDLTSREVYYSWEWKEMFGYDAEQTINRPEHWFDRVHPDDRLGVQTALDAHLTGGSQRFETEHRVVVENGPDRWLLVRGLAVRDANGEPRRIAGSATDLTHRRAVAAASEKSALLQHATSSVGIGIALRLPDETLQRTSPTLVGMAEPWGSPQAWWEAVLASLGNAPAFEQRSTLLAEIATGSGDPKVFEIALTGSAAEIGVATAVVILVKDVTARVLSQRELQRVNEELVVARDQALAASRAKSAFLAQMSHELRTPLNHILGYAEMIEEEGGEAGEDAAKIAASGRDLLALITRLLEISRIEAGIAGLTPGPLPLPRLIADAIDASGVGTVQTGPIPQAELVTDRQAATRIVEGLLRNARQATPTGNVSLTAALKERNGREWVLLTVADDAPALSKMEVRALRDSSYVAGPRGGQLGITWRYIDRLGGSLDVQSHDGEGTQLEVWLPRAVF